MIPRRLSPIVFIAVISACARVAPDATPDGAVKLWLDRMEASEEDPRAIRDAWALLGPDARVNLEERARRTGQLQGRRVEPWQMLADGRFGLRFRPKVMKSNVMGDRASVDVFGDDAVAEHATVRCVHEAGGWRVEPEFPDTIAAPKREGE